MDILSDEIFVQIFIELELVDILRLSLVNKRFHRICPDRLIWIRRRLIDFPLFSNDIDNNYTNGIVDDLKNRNIDDMNIYRIFHDNKWMGSEYERMIIFKLNRGDDDIYQFITENLITIAHSFDDDNPFRLENNERIIYHGQIQSYIKLIESDKDQNYPSHSHYIMSQMYLNLLILIYLSSSYRAGKSINFHNIMDINEFEPEVIILNYSPEIDYSRTGISILFEHKVESPKMITKLYPWMSDFGILSNDSYLIQALHAYTIMYRRYGIYLESLKEEYYNISYYNFVTIDTWKGQKLKDADFWAYKIGDTILYIPPTDFILKISPFAITNKLLYPRLSDYSYNIERSKIESEEKIRNNGMSAVWKSIILNGWIIHLLGKWSSFARKIIELFMVCPLSFDNVFNIHMSKIIDSYVLLQSPYFVGEFMYPKGLTPNSKVIIIGEI